LTKHTILFLAANPLGTDRLALDEEERGIRVALARDRRREAFDLVTRWAGCPLDLLDELHKLKPMAVHSGGHGGTASDCAQGHDVTSLETPTRERARVWDAATGMPVSSPFEHQARVMSSALMAPRDHRQHRQGHADLGLVMFAVNARRAARY
jgi:hypothetical protein